MAFNLELQLCYKPTTQGQSSRNMDILWALFRVLGLPALMEILKALRSSCAYIQSRMNLTDSTLLHQGQAADPEVCMQSVWKGISWSAFSLNKLQSIYSQLLHKKIRKMLVFESINLNFKHHLKKWIKIMYWITEITVRGTHHMIFLPMFSKDQSNNASCCLKI